MEKILHIIEKIIDKITDFIWTMIQKYFDLNDTNYKPNSQADLSAAVNQTKTYNNSQQEEEKDQNNDDMGYQTNTKHGHPRTPFQLNDQQFMMWMMMDQQTRFRDQDNNQQRYNRYKKESGEKDKDDQSYKNEKKNYQDKKKRNYNHQNKANDDVKQKGTTTYKNQNKDNSDKLFRVVISQGNNKLTIKWSGKQITGNATKVGKIESDNLVLIKDDIDRLTNMMKLEMKDEDVYIIAAHQAHNLDSKQWYNYNGLIMTTKKELKAKISSTFQEDENIIVVAYDQTTKKQTLIATKVYKLVKDKKDNIVAIMYLIDKLNILHSGAMVMSAASSATQPLSKTAVGSMAIILDDIIVGLAVTFAKHDVNILELKKELNEQNEKQTKNNV